ncbi:MAG TPA: NTP transferase domain-containing protein [Puia sp.]|nr:NTP transferase domain-containing protein [Puia sp.]
MGEAPLGDGRGGYLIGLVLCGGESRRMGRDKGLMLKDGMPWAQYLGQRLTAYAQVFYSIHPRQLGAYAAILPANRLIVDSLDIPGPLNGLLSVHARMPEADILLAACDMLDLDTATLDRLVAAWQVHDPADTDFIAYGDERLWQPFGCIYTSRGLRKAAGHSGLQSRHSSLQSLLRAGRTQGLRIANAAAFANYNTL